MKLAFWRPRNQLSDAEEADLGDLVAAIWSEEYDRQNGRPVVLPPSQDDLLLKLNEVTAERDELLQALDEERPAPNAFEVGQQLKAVWFATTGGNLSLDERWAAAAETAIDAVRCLWPLDKADVAALDAEAERRLHTDEHGCDSYPFCTCPTQTSPGAPGQRSTPPAAGRGLGSAHAPGDTQLVDVVDAHLERLALRLAVSAGTVTSLTWNLMTDSYREVYRGLAAQVVLAGWLPPGTRSASGNVPAIAEVLNHHDLLVDGTCRCGWPGLFNEPAEVWHAEHVAQQLLAAEVLA